MISSDSSVDNSIVPIALCFCFRNEWPLFVICSSTRTTKWKAEFEKYIGKDYVKTILRSSDGLIESINIITYDLVSKLNHIYKPKKFKTILCDESEYLKNEKSFRNTTLYPMLQLANHCILLNETTSIEKPHEIYSQLKSLETFDINKFEYFERYCGKNENSFGVNYSDSKNLIELKMILSRHFMIRCTNNHERKYQIFENMMEDITFLFN